MANNLLSQLWGNHRQNGSNGHHERKLIELNDIKKIYKTDAGDFLALKGIDLTIDRGEFVGIIGKSGSGKSTLVNMITGIDRPTSGEVFVNDTSIHNFSEGQMAKWRGVSMGVVFQFFQLLPTLTVIENVMLPMDFCNMYTSKERKERAMYLLDLMDVSQQANKLPTMISGGQQQRVAIARALANDPPIVVADEPTGNLDSKTANQVFALFEQLVADGKTFLMVTHDDDLASRMSRIITIADGELINEWLPRVFPSLTQDLLVKANNSLQQKSYAPGEPIIMQDTPGDALYIITSGKVNVYLNRADGREIFVDEMYPGNFFGEMALLGNDLRTATVRADRNNPVEVMAIPRENFIELLQASQETEQTVAEIAQQRQQSLSQVVDEEAS